MKIQIETSELKTAINGTLYSHKPLNQSYSKKSGTQNFTREMATEMTLQLMINFPHTHLKKITRSKKVQGNFSKQWEQKGPQGYPRSVLESGCRKQIPELT